MVLALNYTVDGIPMVYCGNELADTARVNMFANRFYPGKYSFTSRDDEAKNTPCSVTRQTLLKKLNGLRAEDPCFVYGKTEWIDTDCPDDVIAFRRVFGGKTVWFIGNVRKSPRLVTVNSDIPANAEKAVLNSVERKNENTFGIGPYGFIIIRKQ